MTIQKKQLTARQEKTVAAVISAKTVEEGLRQAGGQQGGLLWLGEDAAFFTSIADRPAGIG